MTPDERQLLTGLFDRIRTAGSNQQRDRDAESFISDAVRQQPYAPYLLSQTVIVQEQALKAANERLQQLEAKVQSLESGQGQGQSGGGESFLGGIGRSIFGGGSSQQGQPARSAPPAYSPQAQYAPNQPQYAQPQGGPWGGAAQAGGGMFGGGAGGGGGFLKGALGMAAGVAGGALLGNAVSGLFHGSNNPFGIASGMGGMGGMGGGFPGAGGETIVNNYYNDAPPDVGMDQQGDYDQGNFDNSSDFGSDDGGFGGGGDDGSYNV